jgi:DNA invertase Pin-like site-specific DNA recombinase/ElaB/YqjD/DUF883 family membrane-anchored ribosome-binding protein
MRRPISPEKVAVYIRWSSEDQGEGTTLAIQRDACRHYLLARGWKVRDDLHYIDDGYSGGTLERPALSRLRQAVREGLVDCVVVYRIDRLSRSLLDTVNLVLKEWEGCCFLKSALEPIDTADPAGKMFFYTLVSFAEWERSTIRERTFAGRVRRAREGRSPGGRPPYGYRTGAAPGELVTDPAEAAVVRRIFREYLSGAGTRSVAFRLNAEGIPSPTGGAWQFTTVARLLANPAYTGTLIFGRVSRQSPERPEGSPRLVPNDAPLAVVPGAWPAIVAPAEFERAQAVRRGRPGRHTGTSGRAASSPYLLTGLLRCGLCGSSVRARPAYGSAGAYYFCLGRFTKGPSFCPSRPFIPSALLDRPVQAHLVGRYAQPERLLQQLQALPPERAPSAAILARVRGALRRLEREQVRLGRLLRGGELAPTEYHRLQAELDRELAECRARAGRLQAATTARQRAAACLSGARLELDPWQGLEPVERKRMAGFFLADAIVRFPGDGRPEYELVWRAPEPAGSESVDIEC